MEKRVYKDYFTVPANYKANMTREAINETPETWLDFYPHIKYQDFLKTLLDESKSVWLTGNYGTGKSNAALVTHKLFMDDINRVNKWFEKFSNVIPNHEELKAQLLKARERRTLVVYDYNASGVGPDEALLVRLEKGVLAALKEKGYTVPGNGNLDIVIERLHREGENFFKTRDSILSEMLSLKSNIKTIDQLVEKLLEESKESNAPTHFLSDVQTVFHHDHIYLNVNVTTFREWINAICEANGLNRIIYLFDEFSPFIDANSGTLKTFEDVTETPDINHFFLVPVTHKELSAFYGENSPGAKKARDRFYFRNLQMPNDIAFRLAAFAMKPVEDDSIAAEWKEEKDMLWGSISGVVEKFNDPETSEAHVARKSFYDILPIHPMAAFLLKFLAESARSNQRSIFEYLKGSADGREFQDFIAQGGPKITNRQFLTVDYLWKYFMERDDAGQSKEVSALRMEYDRIKAREFANCDDEQAEIRILKAVLLFTLLSRLNPNGHDRLQPTVENIRLAFSGDGTIMDTEYYLRMLSDRHCFSIVNGTIDLYSSTVGGDELEKKKQELEGKFHDFLSETCKAEFEKQTKRSNFSSGRFDIRVSDVSHTTLTNIQASTRDKYSAGLSKDDGSICLWFVVAKNMQEQKLIGDKQASMLQQLSNHRIVMLSFPEVTFCQNNVNLWDEYVTLRARVLLESNGSSKEHLQQSFERIEKEWTDSLKASGVAIDVRYFDSSVGQIVTKRSSWNDLKAFLPIYLKSNLPYCPDLITDQITVFANKALKGWALAGIRFDGPLPAASQRQLVTLLRGNAAEKEKWNVNTTPEWFAANPEHMFSKIKSLLEKKYENTVGRGLNFSLRKAYIELQRAPYGMRNNALSAFTLGFCLRWVIDKNCQWTNGQMNSALEEEDLAEIIEAAVSEKTDKEKFICRLSREARAFSEKAGCLFGLPKAANSTPISTLGFISDRVEKTSSKVPLWVLSEYIRNTNPEYENVAKVFDDLCVTLRTSSKGNIEERTNAISSVGKALLDEPDIIGIATTYTVPETYIEAFRQYVDRVEPTLPELAARIDDQSHGYCELILDSARGTAGWLWNQTDITALVKQTGYVYRVMDFIHYFLNISGYITYSEMLDRLYDKMKSMGVPYMLIGNKYPFVQNIVNELTDECDSEKLWNALQANTDHMNVLFKDQQRNALISLIRENLGEIHIDDSNLIRIMEDVAANPSYSFDMTIDSYLRLVRSIIKQDARASLISSIADEFKRICGYEDVYRWSDNSHLPAWTLFVDVEDGSELLKKVSSPDSYSDEVLEQAHETLTSLPEVSVERCQKTFLERTVPVKYINLGIELASLLKYLSENHGKNPNSWPEHLNLDAFIRQQYKTVFAPNVVEKLRQEDAKILKEKVMGLVKDDPDVGLRLWEL